MKRTALKRSSPLRRKTRIKPRRSKPRRSSRVRSRPFLLFVKSLPCMFAGTKYEAYCRGVTEASHQGAGHGMGQKSSDNQACPLCHDHHHGGWHQRRVPPFDKWSPIVVRIWSDQSIAQTQALYAQRAELP